MADETTTTEAVKKVSDGIVQITVEKYNELLDTITNQKDTVASLRLQLSKALDQPPVINRTVVEKTAEMAAHDHRAWGGSLMALGAVCFAVGAIRYRAGHKLAPDTTIPN